MAELTTTSFAILGLLNIKPWSAYELTHQAKRSLRYAWPKSESHLYAEPKRLVRLGFARVTEAPAGPVRTRQVYRITAAGRRALQHWLESEPAAPQLEFEAVLRLFYADATDKNAVLSTLAHTRSDLHRRYAEGMALVEAWLGGEAPFPERLHISALVAVFTRDLLSLMIEWSEFAQREIEQWPRTDGLGMTQRTRDLLQRVVDEQPIIDA
ncbi:MAG TPA: PadR family transcriptional regulator [Acidimicrobiia bacterium]|jgi:DNA-binding PadR family transcriptional regulator